MSVMSRRHFLLGAALVGASAATLTSCSSSGEVASGTVPSSTDDAAAVLAGVSMKVRRDPG